MKVIQTTVYDFDELNEKAKEKARDWYRQAGLDYDWWESVYEDAERVGIKITGFDLRGLCEGSFIGNALDTVDKIKSEHGEQCETYKTALRYEPELRRTFALTEKEGSSLDDVDAYDNVVHEFLLDILEDYRVCLEHEEEYLNSEESVDENIRINEYTFTETGKREG